MIDLDGELIGDAVIALRDHRDARQLRQPLEIRQRHGGEGGELDLVGLERRRDRPAIGQHAVDDPVEIGTALLPIARVLLKPVELARPVLAEAEGARADEARIGRVLGDVADLVEMPRDHAGQARQGVPDQLQRRRHGEAEHGRARVGRLHGLQIAEDGAAEILQGLPQPHGAEGDVRRGEGPPVMPADALAQGEADRAPVRGPVQPVASRGSRPSPSLTISAKGSITLDAT